MHQFWDLGLRGTDKMISAGINYKKALDLVNNNLSFLGVGASKLSHEQVFKDALYRCNPDEEIRFLLSNPFDQNLKKAAKRADKPEDKFQNTIIDSLRIIAKLREDREFNIQVHFYPKTPEFFPIFRMFFVDKSLCLLSFNVFGDEGDGSQSPQIYIVNAGVGKRKVNSFYYPFEKYFNWLWDNSKEWDFKKYIDD